MIPKDILNKDLLKELSFNRQRPIYDNEIHLFQKKIHNHEEVNPVNLFKEYSELFDKWLKGSKLNKLQGLDQFKDRDFCVGVTHYIDDLYMRYGSKIRYLENEYSYHWRLGVGKKIDSYEELSEGDHLILSSPFCYYGDLHPQTDMIIDYCNRNNVSVHIDSAWYGCVKDFSFNYDQECIKDIGFSLSKGLGMGHNRTGIRYSRQRENGALTILNDFSMQVCQLMWMGIQLMNEFSCDFMHEKYGKIYDEICERLSLIPTKAIHTAFGKNEDGDIVPVGVRELILKAHKGKF